MLNKKEFIKKFAEQNGCSLADAKYQVDCFLNTFVSALVEDGGVKFTSIMTAKVVNRPERVCTNPKGEKSTIPEGKRVKFSVGKPLKNQLESL